MSIEAGAKVGLVSVDDKTIDYVKGRLLLQQEILGNQLSNIGKLCIVTQNLILMSQF